MNNFLREELSVASMQKETLCRKIVSLNFNRNSNIGLERGGQVILHMETH